MVTLAEKLRIETGAERNKAIGVLAQFGDLAMPAVPALTEIINDNKIEKYVRDSAEWTLNEIKSN